MKKQYSFIILIIIMLYLMYLVLSYKYTEYKIYSYTQNLHEYNESLESKIRYAQEILENKNTKAYKNKVLKSQQGLKNTGEIVVFLIEEEKYNRFTQEIRQDTSQIILPPSLTDEKSLIQTMTIYQRWIYLIFKRDIR